MDTDQENFRLYQRLVHNEPKIRQHAMKSIRDSLSTLEDIDESEVMKVWKGFYYCMWMSDKVPVQQELCRTMAASIHMFKPNVAIKYYRAFMLTMQREFIDIDRHRLDKFLSLIRRCVEAGFIYCRSRKWDLNLVLAFSEIHKHVFSQITLMSRPLSIFVAEVYLSSWAKSYVQDCFFRLIEGEEPVIEDPDSIETKHFHIDMDISNIDQAIAEAAKFSVEPMQYEPFMVVLTTFFDTYNYYNDMATRNAIIDKFTDPVITSLRNFAELASKSDEDEDEDEDQKIRETFCDALAPSFIEHISRATLSLNENLKAEPYHGKAMKHLIGFIAQLTEIKNILIELGITEEYVEQPPKKVKRSNKVENTKSIVLASTEPVVQKKKATKKSQVVEDVSKVVISEPIEKTEVKHTKNLKKKVKKTVVEPVIEPIESEIVEDVVKVVKSVSKKRKASKVSESTEIVKDIKKVKVNERSIEDDVDNVPTLIPATSTVKKTNSITFGKDLIKPFFKKVEPGILTSPKTIQTNKLKVAKKSLLKRK